MIVFLEKNLPATGRGLRFNLPNSWRVAMHLANGLRAVYGHVV
jgi:hypothetical protein